MFNHFSIYYSCIIIYLTSILEVSLQYLLQYIFARIQIIYLDILKRIQGKRVWYRFHFL